MNDLLELNKHYLAWLTIVLIYQGPRDLGRSRCAPNWCFPAVFLFHYEVNYVTCYPNHLIRVLGLTYKRVPTNKLSIVGRVPANSLFQISNEIRVKVIPCFSYFFHPLMYYMGQWLEELDSHWKLQGPFLKLSPF